VSRRITLNTLKAGINRLRTKGGADPSSLYDLLNGYVTIDGSTQSRPGTTEDATLPAGTVGLCAFNDGLVVFSDSAKTGMPDGYTCLVLPYPNDPGDTPPTLTKIHFAAPFLGHLYVVAEFSTNEVFHYWLLATGTDATVQAWQPDHQYNVTDSVVPTVQNGFYYKPANTEFPPAWLPDHNYVLGDVVVPTTLNGWKYTVIEVDGDNPASGSTEPVWPTSDGATVTEDINEASQPIVPPVTPPNDPGGDRYGNPGGAGNLQTPGQGVGAL
jgi:hypothetical protein